MELLLLLLIPLVFLGDAPGTTDETEVAGNPDGTGPAAAAEVADIDAARSSNPPEGESLLALLDAEMTASAGDDVQQGADPIMAQTGGQDPSPQTSDTHATPAAPLDIAGFATDETLQIEVPSAQLGRWSAEISPTAPDSTDALVRLVPTDADADDARDVAILRGALSTLSAQNIEIVGAS